MEVLQCDGCDFRAPSYEDLKAHIQDVHTAFLQPTDVAEDNANESRSGSMNASNQTEVEFSSIKDEFAIAEDLTGQKTSSLNTLERSTELKLKGVQPDPLFQDP
ncbi:ZNF462 [Cervus elaphus hippelaphus]|uniref:ZNF462 n=1 Tax=Cervus elaphus hippelaphus TaxID=46360 RepID=A0A212CMV9_CEREH|nr:ZNF462 [Cervus elaphus hippelaphus]